MEDLKEKYDLPDGARPVAEVTDPRKLLLEQRRRTCAELGALVVQIAALQAREQQLREDVASLDKVLQLY